MENMYIPLHHKYRPQTFADLVGQEPISRTLTNAITQGQIAPAYLFTGARGTGKTSTARIMAKALNCLAVDRPTPDPCGQCELCQTIAKGTALDITEIDAASNTGVDNIRELIERAQFAPVIARYKVYIIDECHMLSGAAFNALLKTLEEPPDRVIFILATTDPQRVLPTIISRCQRYDFRRIPLNSMVVHLQMIADREGIAITPEALLLTAQIAQGGLRDAESLLDQLSLLSGQITPEVVWDLVGTVPERDLLLLLENIIQGDSLSLVTNLKRILDRGREPMIVLQNLASLYRDLLLTKMTIDKPELVTLSDQGWQKCKILAKDLTPAQIIRSQQQLRQAEVQIRNTTQPRLWLEITLFDLLQIPQTDTTAREAITPVASAPTTEAKPIVPNLSPAISNRKPKPIAPPEAPSSQTSHLDKSQLWQQILAQLSPPTRAILTNTLNAQILEIRENDILIGLAEPPEEARKKERTELAKKKRPDLEKAAETILRREIHIRYKFTGDVQTPEVPTPSIDTQTAVTSQPPEPVKKNFQNNSLEVALRNVIDIFGGQILEQDISD
jgi:DNA polymerase-3 subunit gamma/tau